MADQFAPEACHALLMRNAPRVLEFNESRPFASWREQVRAKLRELVGDNPPRVPVNVRRQFERQHEEFFEIRFLFTAEENVDVPCHLLIPRGATTPPPVVICLQGHSPGMHISLGRPNNEKEVATVREGDRDFALQAVRQGFAALAMEQRCFGERADQRPPEIHPRKQTCMHASMVSLLLGRTMIGERVWDVSRAIDALAEFPQLDLSRIACMGNSGGGTITYFAACLDERIRAAMPSCYVCTFRDSIGSIDHCPDNYLPGVLKWFEMGDLAGLIAPRPLVVVAGKDDPIFPIAAVEETFGRIERIYQGAGEPDRCRLVVGAGGHRFYAQQAWPVFRGLTGW